MGAPLSIPRHKLSTDDYHKMGEAGILREDDRVELIEGELIEMAPIRSRHAGTVSRIDRLLYEARQNTIIWGQYPISLPPDNEPQPDIMLLAPRSDDYINALPTAQEVLLLIEVADSSLEYDRDTKIPIYARHGIPEIWLFDLRNSTLSIYLDPSPNGYRKLLNPVKTEVVSPSLLPGAKVPLAQVWR
jgi:Uma2 family endonuclease